MLQCASGTFVPRSPSVRNPVSSDDAAPDDLASTRAAAARRGHTAVSPPARIPTGFAALDAALGGGVPRQRITEIGGVPTSGMATLALKIVAQAHARGGGAGVGGLPEPVHAFGLVDRTTGAGHVADA